MYYSAVWSAQGNPFLPRFERLSILPTRRAGWKRTLSKLFLQLRVGKRQRGWASKAVCFTAILNILRQIQLDKAAVVTGTGHMGEIGSWHLYRLTVALLSWNSPSGVWWSLTEVGGWKRWGYYTTIVILPALPFYTTSEFSASQQESKHPTWMPHCL